MTFFPADERFRRDRSPGAQPDGTAWAVGDPMPLFPPAAAPQPYPVYALGDVLGPAAAAVAKKVQVAPAMAAQSVLAAAALATQGHADVLLPFGQRRALSLFLLTVAESGDRKSTTDTETLRAIRRHERDLCADYRLEMDAWNAERGAWAAEKKKIENDRKRSLSDKKELLLALGPEPPHPLYPILTAPDPTIEGLGKFWENAHPSLGIFTAEGGQLVGGHGFSREHALKSAASFSELWDGLGMRRLRAGDGLINLPGRRLSMHLMIQPGAARDFLGRATLRDQGLLSRFLVAAPESLAGSRLSSNRCPSGDDLEVAEFEARLMILCKTPLPTAARTRNELQPRLLTLSPEAERLFDLYGDKVELLLGPTGSLEPIRDVAAKSGEQAARIAGVITLLGDPSAQIVSADVMADAIQLAEWYLFEALRLVNVVKAPPELTDAKDLLDWIHAKGVRTFTLRDVVRLGPSRFRMKKVAQPLLKILTDHGWLVQKEGQWIVVGGSA